MEDLVKYLKESLEMKAVVTPNDTTEADIVVSSMEYIVRKTAGYTNKSVVVSLRKSVVVKVVVSPNDNVVVDLVVSPIRYPVEKAPLCPVEAVGEKLFVKSCVP